jgi:hypothetical protein
MRSVVDMSVAMTLVSVVDLRDEMILAKDQEMTVDILQDIQLTDHADVMILESVVDLRDVMIVETQWIQEDLLLLLSLVSQSGPL